MLVSQKGSQQKIERRQENTDQKDQSPSSDFRRPSNQDQGPQKGTEGSKEQGHQETGSQCVQSHTEEVQTCALNAVVQGISIQKPSQA